MANPLGEIDAYIAAKDLADELPAGTTYGVELPDAQISALYIQYAWDGTPSDAANREGPALRITVWAPRDRPSDAQDYARTLLDLLLYSWTSANLWCVSRGLGRQPGTDPDTDLPFCTFTVYPQLKATTPADLAAR